MRNVEIKARVGDLERSSNKVVKLAEYCVQLLTMTDTFFNVNSGRLKLREQKLDGGAESHMLIHYQRDNQTGPKLSDFSIVNMSSSDSQRMKGVLTAALGVRGRVVKRRQVYMIGRTRVHLDTVESLGDFIELEVQLSEGESIEQGQLEADRLMNDLDISKSDLIDCAYIDILEKRDHQ